MPSNPPSQAPDAISADNKSPMKYARLRTIEAMFGMKRARSYELLSAGSIRAIKDGRALLIEVASVEAYLATRPPATIRLGRKRQAETDAATPEG